MLITVSYRDELKNNKVELYTDDTTQFPRNRAVQAVEHLSRFLNKHPEAEMVKLELSFEDA